MLTIAFPVSGRRYSHPQAIPLNRDSPKRSVVSGVCSAVQNYVSAGQRRPTPRSQQQWKIHGMIARQSTLAGLSKAVESIDVCRVSCRQQRSSAGRQSPWHVT